ncbi:hypothetical protein F2Q68_00009060 [Brassica cretica]|uniref:Uncharacterized protein n=1 Tax=Brassica cretica TaxID=69181 RepID=A0A8S9KQ03_BRACR|nr:hypothetical protein F2Q68_00009060 [Brassica cretica]
MDGELPTVRLSPSFYTRYISELDFQCHRFEVNHHPVAEVMPVLLKSGQSASREEAVEKMKDCRSMKHHWCRSTVLKMEDMNFGPKLIDAQTTTSSDGSTEKSINTLLPISIDAILPEATKKATINLDEEEEELEEDVEIDRQKGNNVDRQKGNNVDRLTMINIDRQNENNVDRCSTPAKRAVERVYRTLPPFPPNKTQTKRELDKTT